jgi:hypothetical protein
MPLCGSAQPTGISDHHIRDDQVGHTRFFDHLQVPLDPGRQPSELDAEAVERLRLLFGGVPVDVQGRLGAAAE